jgi:hypothetical protein
MGMFCHAAMQAALHEALLADDALVGMVEGVYDHVPAKTAYPYVTIGDMRATDVSAVETQLVQMQCALHLYSRERGRKEISTIMQRLHDLLHDTQLSMASYSMIRMHYAGSQIAQERDGLTYHGQMRFEVMLQYTEA